MHRSLIMRRLWAVHARAVRNSLAPMNDGAKPQSPKDARAARLEAALRQNLKRRKAQARARSQPRDEPSAPHDSAGIPAEKDN